MIGSPISQAAEGTKFQDSVKSSAGVVASVSDYSSAVGIDVLNRGGNAVDAAVAMVFAVGVARPEMGGIGGGGFLVYRGHNHHVAALDFREAAPASVTPTTYMGSGMHKDTDGVNAVGSGHMVVGVPGVVAGMAEALRKYGSKKFTLGQLISSGAAPNDPSKVPYAYELARDGVRITYEMASYLLFEQNRLQYYPETRKIYLGKVWGDNLKQEDYARSLALIAKYGPDAFYKDGLYPEGPSIARLIASDMATAQAASATNPVIIATSAKWGGTPNDIGLLTLADLSAYRPVWRTPLVSSYRGAQIIAMPPPTSGGIATIQTLNLIEGFPLNTNTFFLQGKLRDFRQSRADHLHVLAEAQKIAWADRNHYVADPGFRNVPTQTLTSKEYAAQRRTEIDLNTAKFNYQAGNVGGIHTNHLSVIDRHGNAVAVTSSVGNPFGSVVVAPGTGFVLADELTDFNMDQPGTANEPNGRKRPRSSQSPTIVVKNHKAVLVVGGAGGPAIPMGVIQATVNVMDFKLDIAHAVDAERIEARLYGDKLGIEDTRMDDAVEADLQSRGHTLELHGEYAAPPIVNAVGFNLATGLREAVSDPRNETDEDHGQGAAGQ